MMTMRLICPLHGHRDVISVHDTGEWNIDYAANIARAFWRVPFRCQSVVRIEFWDGEVLFTSYDRPVSEEEYEEAEAEAHRINDHLMRYGPLSQMTDPDGSTYIVADDGHRYGPFTAYTSPFIPRQV